MEIDDPIKEARRYVANAEEVSRRHSMTRK